MASASSAVAASSSSAGTTPVHQTEVERLGAVHHPRGEREFLGPVHADALAQQPRRAEVEADAALGEDGREARPVGAHGEVAGERQARSRHPPPRRRPRAMVGTGQPCTATTASPSTRMPASWLPIGPLLLPLPPALAPLAAPAQVGTGAEVGAAAGEHDHARARVRESPEGLADGDPHVAGARVLGVGAVDGDGGDVAVLGDLDVGMDRERFGGAHEKAYLRCGGGDGEFEAEACGAHEKAKRAQ